MTNYTELQAIECQSKVITCGKKFYKDLRLLLIDAFEGKAHKALNLDGGFTAFLNCIAKKSSNLSTSYMNRQLHAGQVEILIIGRERVGEIPEGAARVLFENVTPEHRKEVYEVAYRSMAHNRCHPTIKQLIEAAESMGVYSQQEAKKKVNQQKIDTVEAENTSNKTKKVTSPAPSKSIVSNVVKIKKDEFSLKKCGRNLITKLGVKKAEILSDMLYGASDSDIYKEFSNILKIYDIDDVNVIGTELDKALAVKLEKSKKAQMV